MNLLMIPKLLRLRFAYQKRNSRVNSQKLPKHTALIKPTNIEVCRYEFFPEI